MTSPLLSLPIAPADALRDIIRPAFKLLPSAMRSDRAELMVLAIFLQESALANRWQVIDRQRPDRKGPARGLAQFELGSAKARGGVWGVVLHDASRFWLARACDSLGMPCAAAIIWSALERNDVLAAVLARLLLFTDPQLLPTPGSEEAAWQLYLRTWRPGAYTRGTPTERAALRAKWRRNYGAASAALASAAAA